MAYIDQIDQYESGELDDDEALTLFAGLIKTGVVWSLQGHYGRTAHSLIESGYITPEGELTEAGREFLTEKEN